MKALQGSVIASFVILTMMLSFPLAVAQIMGTPNTAILSPLKQLKHGTQLQNIKCQTGLVLAMNIHRDTPACLRQSTLDKLANRGWVPVIPTQLVSTENQTEQQQILGRIIILQDNGTTIQLHKGDTFLLKLGDSYGWKWNIDNQTVVGIYRGHIGYMLVRGAQGIFEAYNIGHAVLSADGTPACLSLPPNNQASPCNTSTVHFRLDINAS